MALPAIARALRAQGVEVTIATTDDDGAGCRVEVPLGVAVRDDDGAQRIHFRKSTEFYKVSWSLGTWLRQHVADFDVVHMHALFSYSSLAAARAAKRAGVPYIVRPLGVLNRWGMKHRRQALKKWSLRFVEMPILRSAAAIHFTAEAERREAAEANAEIGKLPSVVIPLPVEVGDGKLTAGGKGTLTASPAGRGAAPEDRCVILFLSRIDPKKGVELLLAAFALIAAEFPGSRLMIAGDGERNYLKSLKMKASQLGIEDRILWTGFLAGEEKARAFAESTLFVLPSYSENFGIAAAEALAAGVPSILSENVAVAEDARAADAALVVPCNIAATSAALRRLLRDAELRERLATNGRKLVRDRFSYAAVGARLAELYRELIAKAKSDA